MPTNPEAQPPQPVNQEALAPMSGDGIIPQPDAAWDTTIVVQKPLDEAWSGRFGITRMGAVGEGYAGLLLPQRLDPLLPEHLRSLPKDATHEPKRLQVGDTIPDSHKDDRSEVVELDDDHRTIVFETRWKSENSKPGLHYTWQVTARPGETEGTTELIARTRMENLKRPALGRLLWPRIDRFAMKFIGEGISRDDSLPEPRATMGRRLGNLAIKTAGKIKARRDQKAKS